MSSNRLTLRDLADPEFLAAVSRLQLFVRRVARGGMPAEQRSLHLGGGMEFRDFRPYTPGDDFRAIDWNIYRRLGRVVLKLFEELEDLPVYLAVDVSKSMFQGENPRGHAALKAAFALASVALQQHDKVAVFPFSDELEVAMRPSSGHGKQMRVAQVLADLEPKGRTDFERSMRRLNGLGLRRGLLVLISDFFDAAGLEAIERALKGVRHRLLFIQLVRADDAQPGLEGDLRLLDCETGQARDVSLTPSVRAAYEASYRRFQEGLLKLAQSKRAGLLRLDVDEPVVDQIASLLADGVHAL